MYDPTFLKVLSKVVQENPLEDTVYYLPSHSFHRDDSKPWWSSCSFGDIKETEGTPNCVLAGSAALELMWKKLYEKQDKNNGRMCTQCDHCKDLYPIQEPTWTSNDCDIFFLGAKKAHRCSLGKVDFVYCP